METGPNYYLSFLNNHLHPLRNCGWTEHQLWPEQSKYPLFVTEAHNELAKNSTDICFVFEEASSDRKFTAPLRNMERNKTFSVEETASVSLKFFNLFTEKIAYERAL